MQKLHFVCKQNPDCYPFTGERYLYNSAAYLQLKAARFGMPVSFYALRGELAVARIHFFEQLTVFVPSPAINLSAADVRDCIDKSTIEQRQN